MYSMSWGQLGPNTQEAQVSECAVDAVLHMSTALLHLAFCFTMYLFSILKNLL